MDFNGELAQVVHTSISVYVLVIILNFIIICACERIKPGSLPGFEWKNFDKEIGTISKRAGGPVMAGFARLKWKMCLAVGNWHIIRDTEQELV